MKTYQSLFVFFILLNTCTTRQPVYSLEDADVLIDINKLEGLRLDTVGDKRIKYIPLETTQDCLIGSVDKVLIKRNRIFIADFSNTASLFVFDISGKHLFTIDYRGNGPGEYMNMKDFDVLSNGTICIWDVDLCKLLFYGTDGLFIKDVQMVDRLAYFCSMDQHYYLAEISKRGTVVANLQEYDGNDKSVRILVPSREIYDLDLVNYSYHKFYYSPTTTYYVPRFSEVIYSVDNDSIHPAIGLMNLPIPPDDLIKQWSRRKELMFDDTDYIKDIVHVYETNRYISLQLETGTFFNLLYDKISQKSYRLEPLYKTTGMFYIQGSTGAYFFGIMQPDREYLSRIMEQERALTGLTEDSNPVVVLLDFSL